MLLSSVLVGLLIIVALPFMALNGKPIRFSRMNWVGVAVGAAVLSFVFFTLGMALDKPLASSLPTLIPFAVFLSIAIGSLVSVFFCNPKMRTPSRITGFPPTSA